MYVHLLREYVTGIPAEVLGRRYGYSVSSIRKLVDEFRAGKIDIFGEARKNTIMKGIDSRDEEIRRLRNEVELLKNDLNMANITIEGYQIMQRIYKEEYGVDLSKKSGAEQSQSLKKATKK